MTAAELNTPLGWLLDLEWGRFVAFAVRARDARDLRLRMMRRG